MTVPTSNERDCCSKCKICACFFIVVLVFIVIPVNFLIILIPKREPAPPLPIIPHLPRFVRVIIDQTATENCYSKASCKNQIENGNFYSPFLGIKKTYFVGGDGYVQEEHYFRTNSVHHAPGFYLDSISITFIGTFSILLPTEKQILATQSIIKKNIDSYDLVWNYRLYGARQLMTTDSPGDALYAIIQTWPNWVW